MHAFTPGHLPLIFLVCLVAAVLAFSGAVALVRYKGGMGALGLSVVLIYVAAAGLAGAILSGAGWWLLA